MAIHSTTPPAGAPLRLPEEEQWAGPRDHPQRSDSICLARRTCNEHD